MDKQQGSTYSTRNCIQYPVINCNGKEIYIYTHTHTHTHIYIYVCITESPCYTLEHNVIQHCKSTILQ